MKNIVLCSDGTWNYRDKEDRGTSAPTNVVKAAWAADIRDPSRQFVWYDPGVGTGKIGKLTGGITGLGLSKNVRDAYKQLIDLYEPGDKVFLFGFSRGAYTSRSLTGLIKWCGLLPKNKSSLVLEAYEIYRRGDEKEAERFRKQAGSKTCHIEMVGVWDTVSALYGLSKRTKFHDISLSPFVKAGYQALAIDERRNTFSPVLWDEENKGHDQIIEQVWFAGVHSNIGGGYLDAGLSDIALLWMLSKASKHGLLLDTDYLKSRISPNYRGFMRDSAVHIWRLGRKRDREIRGPIHESVRRRRQDRVLAYQPGSLDKIDQYSYVDSVFPNNYEELTNFHKFKI